MLGFLSFDREAERSCAAAAARRPPQFLAQALAIFAKPRRRSGVQPAHRWLGGETAHVYTDTRYAARTWDHERRVVIKAEVVRLGDREPRDNPRFVVTNLRQTPRFIYEKVYCARGDIENRIKELLDGLQIDRTSCCLFSANQLRVFLTAAAYVLMQELRLRAARTACARSRRGCATGC